MKNYLLHDEWCVIEEGFHPEYNRITESVCSLGNGRMGQRGNFEERYSGDSLSGNYVAGVYYPDKTRVGWWKNGYPEYFAKVLNAANWIGIDVAVDGEPLDLHLCKVRDFRRTLNMKEGYLERSFVATLPSGKEVAVHAKRFCSIAMDEVGAIRYAVTPLSGDVQLTFAPSIDVDVENEDSNYDEKFWVEIAKKATDGEGYVVAETKKTQFWVATAMKWDIFQDKKKAENLKIEKILREKFVANSTTLAAKQGQETVLYKYAANVSSENYPKEALKDRAKAVVAEAYQKAFDHLLNEQAQAWGAKWQESDILIEGDVAAQQGIRFNIFQLNQTYTGEDPRLNIGPKGFTGEKYGGSTYWDTEAYCIPFYLSTAAKSVSRNLLVYRHKHLPRAIENAAKLGFKNGAALYPMVTMNGEECHNEWEITFEEIHRNGAIAYAIHDYVRYTGDQDYLAEYGAEVLIGIARFWAQRVNWSTNQNKFVMLGVTGPNEFENNVNNNFYTNYIAAWCMDYARQSLAWIQTHHHARYAEIVALTTLDETGDLAQWKHISENMYYPYDAERDIYLQQDGFLDKDLITVKDIPANELPIVQHWSWDRILRSVFIKQADTLQGLYFFEENFDVETLKRHYDFYEPRTVHESSLSPCVHSILAARIGDYDRAYEFYLRTARLDLDDYNNDSCDGCHITSMAGTWMSVVKGFGGMRVRDGQLWFAPYIPAKWTTYAFKVRFRENLLNVRIKHGIIEIENLSDTPITLCVDRETYTAAANSSIEAVILAR